MYGEAPPDRHIRRTIQEASGANRLAIRFSDPSGWRILPLHSFEVEGDELHTLENGAAGCIHLARIIEAVVLPRNPTIALVELARLGYLVMINVLGDKEGLGTIGRIMCTVEEPFEAVVLAPPAGGEPVHIRLSCIVSITKLP